MIELPSPCLVVLVGPTGSGKSVWAQTHLPENVVSSDALRGLVGESESDLRASTDAFALLDQIVERRLRRRLTTVIDTLGTDTAKRETWRRIAASHGVPCVALIFEVTSTELRRRNRERAQRVPDATLRRQIPEWPGVVERVRAEPFAFIHEVSVDEVATLVPPSLGKRRPAAQPTAQEDPQSGRALTFGLQIPHSPGQAGRLP